jgi:hypothetical protein
MTKKSLVVPDSVVQAEKSSPDMGLDRWEMAANVLQIDSEERYRMAGESLVRITSGLKLWNNYWESIVRPIKTAYDAARGKRDEVSKRMEAVRATYEAKMSGYRKLSDQLRRESEARLEAAAEALRISLSKEARELLIAGRRDDAVATMEQARNVFAPRMEVERSRISGVTPVEDYDVEIVDLIALVIAVAKGEVPLYGTVAGKRVSLIEIRESVIKEARKSMGEAFDYPGVKVTPKTGYRVRAEE